jgi:hypothetical protein
MVVEAEERARGVPMTLGESWTQDQLCCGNSTRALRLRHLPPDSWDSVSRGKYHGG